MNKNAPILIFTVLSLSISNCLASIAKVTMIRGHASVRLANKAESQLRLHATIPEGAVIATKEKSLVKLTFID